MVNIYQYNEYRYKGNIHGHMHSKAIDDPFYINVSIERLPNLQPIEFDLLTSIGCQCCGPKQFCEYR